MEFRIADTFTESLARLTGEEQKAVKTAAFDLQLNAAQPGPAAASGGEIEGPEFLVGAGESRPADDRPSNRTSLLLCYVNHHDEAYEWARRRKLETHPNTGAAQLVEIRETVQEIVIPEIREACAVCGYRGKRTTGLRGSGRMGCGRPEGRRGRAADAGSASAGGSGRSAARFGYGAPSRDADRADSGPDPFAHPDAQRRFRVMRSVDELERALEYPWDRWTIFLHPAQRALVDRDYNGPARVSGSAGTGKTIVALHRAASLARRHPEARILLTTFSEPLASALRSRLAKLLGNEPRLGERVEVHSMTAAARRLYRAKMEGPARRSRERTPFRRF